MITKTVVIDESIRDLIESYDYEYNSRKELISFMIANNMDITTESFKAYQKEMTHFLVKFNTAKEEISKKYVYPIIGDKEATWNLSYPTCELTINYQES